MKIPSAEFWYNMGVIYQGIRDLEIEVSRNVHSQRLTDKFKLLKEKSETICNTVYQKEGEEDA